MAEPDSVLLLKQTPIEQVTEQQFCSAYIDWATYIYHQSPGVQFQPVEVFFQPGDLQHLFNVVSWWPENGPKNIWKPDLYLMLRTGQIIGDNPPYTFRAIVDGAKSRMEQWCLSNRMDPENPNESKTERQRRLTRERVAAHRARTGTEHRAPDATFIDLDNARKALVLSVRAGKKWVAEQDLVIKAEAAQRMAANRALLAAEQKKLEDANLALETYKAQ